MRRRRVQTEEGFEFEMMQVVPIQRQEGQAVERSQSLRVDLGNVVAAQLEHLRGHTGQTRFPAERRPAGRSRISTSSPGSMSRLPRSTAESLLPCK